LYATVSRLASAATLGIHANRVNTQIPGSRANVTLGPTPTFYYRPVKDEGGLDLILTRLTVKNGRRQFEVGAQGIFRASKGVSVRHQMDFDADEVEPGLYKLVLTHKLEAGQYAFYLEAVNSPQRTKTVVSFTASKSSNPWGAL
jgi:hypothetical protein